jgi:membrane-associated protein
MHGLDLAEIIRTVGYLGVFAIVFAESGLLIGFFLPGDSLLFTAGFLASQEFFSIHLLVLGCFLAAVTGDSVGYFMGHKWGRRLFHREDSIFFHKDHLMRAEKFYEKHGGKTIILARFMPVIRTFAPIVAGVGKMHYTKFLSYNVIGGALWGIGLPYAGYYLGKSIPDVDKYLLPIVAMIIIVSILPGIIGVLKHKENRSKLLNLAKQTLKLDK